LELLDQGRFQQAEALVEEGELAAADRRQLLGYIFLVRGDCGRASTLLRSVVEKAPQRRAAWLYLAVALHRCQRPDESLRALEQVEKRGLQTPGYFALKARGERLTGTSTAAYGTVVNGLRRFNDDAVLLREQVSLLIEIRALATARSRFQRLLSVSASPVEERLWLARALTESKDLQGAAAVLELAHLQVRSGGSSAPPGLHQDIAAQLAWTYAQLGNSASAGRLLDPVYLGSARYAFESADQYRIAGDFLAALRANRYVSDFERRANQRIVILVEAGRPEEATAFALGLPDPEVLDDSGLFALSYGLHVTGRRDLARDTLQRIVSPASLPGYDALKERLGSLKEPSEVDP
jgi:predicted Zn-dependent protease